MGKLDDYFEELAERAESKKPTTIGTWVLTIGLVVPFLYIPLIAWNIWLTWLAWNWFFVPLGLPAITAFHAVGIGTIITWLAGPRPDREARKNPLGWIYRDLKRDATFLVFMWIAHFFV